MNSEPILEVRHLNVWYRPSGVLRRGRQQVLHDVSFDLYRGEILGLVGESGSGKSTLIKTVNGLEPVQQGQIIVDGTVVNDKKTNLAKLRSHVGMVFQHFNLWSHMTVLENVMEAPIQVLGLSKQEARERAVKYLAKVGIDERQQAKYPVHLSGGQQQRVSIARALAMEPEVLLFDEPTNHLDVDAKDELKRALQEYKGSILMVCHEPEFYDGLATQVWDLSQWTTKI